MQMERLGGGGRGGKQDGALRLTHLTSRWRTHCTAEKHWAKLNIASRDKRFSLRLGNHRCGVGRGPSLVSSDKT